MADGMTAQIMVKNSSRTAMADGVTARITVNNSQAVYYPGEMIKGTLFIKTRRSPRSIAQMQLKLLGAAKVQLSRYDILLKQRRTYTNTEVYINRVKHVQDLTVVPHRDTLTSGVHAYEFCFMLPPGAPPSFVGTYGNINYSLSLHTAQGVQVTQQYVGVVGTLDVSSHPGAMVENVKGGCCLSTLHDIRVAAWLERGACNRGDQIPLREPVYREVENVKGSCCLTTLHDIRVAAWLERGGCNRGDQIPLRVEIQNNSDIMVKCHTIKLKREITYHSMGERETTKAAVAEFPIIRRGPVPPKTHMTWDPNDVMLTLPATLPLTGPPGCSLIRLTYELKVTIVPKGCADNVVLTLPLVIGAEMPSAVREQVQRNVDANRALAIAALISMLPERDLASA